VPYRLRPSREKDNAPFEAQGEEAPNTPRLAKPRKDRAFIPPTRVFLRKSSYLHDYKGVEIFENAKESVID
jgi:hypothetical protein